MNIVPLTGGLGAEIMGADIRRAADFDAIRAAFAEYSVIVLRDQDVRPEEHLEFARRFGTINVNRFFKPVDGYPEIATVCPEGEGSDRGGRRRLAHGPFLRPDPCTRVDPARHRDAALWRRHALCVHGRSL